MRKQVVALSLLLSLTCALTPAVAKADSFSFSFSDGNGYGYAPPGPPSHGHGNPHWRHHHRPRHVVYAPPVVYAAPVRTVVYTQPQYVVPASSVVADPVSSTYTNQYGQMCREYQSSGWVGGSQGRLYGTACLQPDGSWRVVD